MTAFLAALGSFSGIAACDVPDDTADIPGAEVVLTTDVDVNEIRPAQTIPMMVEVANVYLIEPTATPPPAQAADAGHLQFYLDDESTAPLLVTADHLVSVTVPAEASPGPHTIICRLHAHDGRPTAVRYSVDIVVNAAITS